ncbi:Phosphorelay intermediate protein [Kickxella alabastrina]|uniref:Phosphorelay intermediate protein n=1 Tax=Kickxella alabastrina TaxID=61397 RepID=A0ACC1IAB5_9FUNG|nr:Phosphorelay intermediate protein [Kickxella alabastrina]
MDKAFRAKDLSKLSSLGHFLKGSSATIGIKKGAEGEGTVDKEEALRLIECELRTGKEEYQKAEEFLQFFYEADPGDDEDDDA